jgi:hypothetical protein
MSISVVLVSLNNLLNIITLSIFYYHICIYLVMDQLAYTFHSYLTPSSTSTTLYQQMVYSDTTLIAII